MIIPFDMEIHPMKTLNILKKLAVFQMVLGLLGAGSAFADTLHISGSTQQKPQSIISHISGVGHPGQPASVKHHVSGAEQVVPAPVAPVKRKVQKKARNKVKQKIVSAKSVPSTKKQIRRKSGPEKTTPVIEQASLQDRARRRKACWAQCEKTWKMSMQEQCSGLSGVLQTTCKKSLFKDRLQCVRQNCRKLSR
ncbi:hypothetical protein UR09_00875 [Candidatus Nitromaritima sp. SCGC AAA799-A02]|nr:hypothetical protein UZ36_06985 [Candidatus Nitromaritima sp. SCGC AAA799-C22]KMP12612.1 hypothetical protein UR09_00875 [Candidatus Nitromaritima sp. SCGC AAA799-A02]